MPTTQLDTQAVSRLNDDWLTALQLLAPAVPSFNSYRVFTRTRLVLNPDASHVAHVAEFKAAGPFGSSGRSVTHKVNPIVLTFPLIERAEIMMSFALESWKWLEEKEWKDVHKTAERLGVDWSNSIHPRERWRLILSRGMDKTNPLWILEDRPLCQWCDKAMPTGSDCHPIREGVHENCGYELDGLAKVAFKELLG